MTYLCLIYKDESICAAVDARIVELSRLRLDRP